METRTAAEQLAAAIEARGMTQAGVARATGVGRATINGLVHGKKTPSGRLAANLQNLFGIPASAWWVAPAGQPAAASEAHS